MAMKAHTRRDFLRAATTAAVGVSGTAALFAFETPRTQAAQAPAIAANAGLIPYGAAVRSGALASDPAYRAAIIANCQIIVPEGEMKWPDIHPARGEYRFEKADALMDFARQNGIKLRGHTLAWYGGMPAWTAGIDSRAEAERIADVDVVSAQELTGEQSKKLQAVLERRLGLAVRLHPQVDKSLVGGAIVRYRDFVVDGSLRGRIERLGAAMSGA